MDSFTIKDIENLSGIKAHTLRIWEQRYSLIKPSRTDTNIRYYSNDDLKSILNIATLNKFGYKISHINRMSAADIQTRIDELNSAEAIQERILNKLIGLMIDMDITGVEGLLTRQISLNGMEKTINRILLPFFERIGILWQTGHINPAQEHLITNIIRQKIITGIDQLKPLRTIDRRFLLFLPEKEHHEFGLLFVYYLLKSRGATVYYIGANVPLNDAKFVADVKKPHYIYQHLTSVPAGFHFGKFLSRLSTTFPDCQIMISGFITENHKKRIPGNVHFLHSLGELINFTASL